MILRVLGLCVLIAVFQIGAQSSTQDHPCKGQHVVLTFDDGPHPVQSNRVLDALQKAGTENNSIPATFYILGNSIESANEKRIGNLKAGDAVLQRISINKAWDVGNHTRTHPNLANIRPNLIASEISYLQNSPKYKSILETQGGKDSFRAPYGGSDAEVENELFKKGYNHHIKWDLDSQDWAIQSGKVFGGNQIYKSATPEQKRNGLVQKIRNDMRALCVSRRNTKNIPIVMLFHDIHPVTADALPQILADLKQNGVVFKGLHEVEKYSKASWIPTHSKAPTEPTQTNSTRTEPYRIRQTRPIAPTRAVPVQGVPHE